MTLALAYHAPSAPTLRPYQIDAIEAVRARFIAGDRGTIIVMATGLGKTVIFAEIARRTVTRGHRALVLAHRTELIDQALGKLQALGVHAAVEQGPRRAGAADVVVASVQTLRGARLASWPADAFDLVIIDECHHATATTYRAIVDHFARARILGVTATPDRADGAGLGPIFQSVAYEFDLPAAIKAGWLAPLVARRIKLDVDLDRVKTKAGDLDQAELAAAMTDPAVIEATVRGLLDSIGDRPTVVFTADVAHAHLLAGACNDVRPGCARAVSGKTADEERATIASDLSSRRVQLVMNCNLLTEGWDCPEVACIAIARPTKSRSLFTQMVGRGTRTASGKVNCLVLDFAGLTRRHKLVCSVDILAGAGLSEEERDEVNERMDGETDFDTALAEARAAIARARNAPTLRWIAEEVTGLLGEVDAALFAPGFDLATTEQREMLKGKGLMVPHGCTDLAAAHLLALIDRRKLAGLCSVKQVRYLGTLGISRETAKDFTAREAGFAIGMLGAYVKRRAEIPRQARIVMAKIDMARRQREQNDAIDLPPVERNNWKRHR